MAVTTQGMATEFNSTVAKLKKWSDSQTDAQLLELGEYLYTFPPAGKKKQVSFHFNPRLEKMQVQAAPGFTAVRMNFNHDEWNTAKNKVDYIEDIISAGILNYMEQIRADKFESRSFEFWRHYLNLGVVCREDVPHVPIEHLVDIGDVNTPYEFMEEFIANTSYDLNWFFGCDTDSLNMNDELQFDRMVQILTLDSSNEIRHQLLKAMKLNTTEIASAMKGWRLFQSGFLKANSEGFSRWNLAKPMLKIELIYSILKSEGKLKELKPIAELYSQLLAAPNFTDDEMGILALVAREAGIETDLYIDGKPIEYVLYSYLTSDSLCKEAQESVDRIFFRLKASGKSFGVNELIDRMKLYPNADFYLDSDSYRGLQVLQNGFLDFEFNSDRSKFKTIANAVGRLQQYSDRIHLAPDDVEFRKVPVRFVCRT